MIKSFPPLSLQVLESPFPLVLYDLLYICGQLLLTSTSEVELLFWLNQTTETYAFGGGQLFNSWMHQRRAARAFSSIHRSYCHMRETVDISSSSLHGCVDQHIHREQIFSLRVAWLAEKPGARYCLANYQSLKFAYLENNGLIHCRSDDWNSFSIYTRITLNM